MATIEDELLALAGESSDDEVVKQDNEDVEEAGHTDSDAADAAIATTPTPKKKKRVARKRQEASEDEGEASGQSEDGSIAGDQSEDDEGAASDTAGPLYPFEGKFHDSKDKARIMGLPEIEREAIIEERNQQEIRRRQDAQLRLRAQDAKKRKASAAEAEENLKKRKLPGGRKSAALESYKASREKKGQRQNLTVDDARRGRSRSESVSRAGGEESEVEWDNERDKSTGPQYDEPAEYVDFYRAQVTRTMMAQHCFNSGFNRTVTGCFARIACPPERPGGPPVYKMSKIESVRDDGKPYEVEGSSGVRFTIKKWLVTSIAKSRKEFPTVNCSNDRITVNEFNEYRAALENAGASLSKKSHLTTKNKELLNMVHHTLTQEEVEEKLRKSGVAGRKQRLIQVQVLRRELEDARGAHDESNVAKLEAELRDLGEDVAVSSRPSQDFAALTGVKSEQERLAELNRKARKENVDNVRRAQRKDLQRNAERRAAQAKAAKAAAANGGVSMESSQIVNSQAHSVVTNGHGSQTLASLIRGDHDNDDPIPGKIDFRKYDAIWQFGTLSRRKGDRKSVFKRTLFRTEMIAALDLDIEINELDL